MTTLTQTIANQAITIGTTDVIDINYELKGGSTHGQYIFANTDATLDIQIGDTKLVVLYQNGHSYDYGDYNHPTNDFELYDEGVIGRIYNNAGEFDIDDYKEVQSALAAIGLEGFTESDIYDLYELLTNYRPTTQSLSIETDPNDFIYTVEIGEGDTEEKSWNDLESWEYVVDVQLA